MNPRTAMFEPDDTSTSPLRGQCSIRLALRTRRSRRTDIPTLWKSGELSGCVVRPPVTCHSPAGIHPFTHLRRTTSRLWR
jgi:hypothetical protein